MGSAVAVVVLPDYRQAAARGVPRPPPRDGSGPLVVWRALGFDAFLAHLASNGLFLDFRILAQPHPFPCTVSVAATGCSSFRTTSCSSSEISRPEAARSMFSSVIGSRSDADLSNDAGRGGDPVWLCRRVGEPAPLEQRRDTARVEKRELGQIDHDAGCLLRVDHCLDVVVEMANGREINIALDADTRATGSVVTHGD
jgi:hypothetical protein